MISLDWLFYILSPLIQINTVDWIERGARFYTNLLSGNFYSTYQSYHPGVTLMWIIGACERLFYNFQEFYLGYRINVLDYRSFPSFAVFTGLMLLLIYLLFIIIAYTVLRKSLGNFISFFICFFMLFEPFLFGFMLSIGPDAMLTLFIFMALVFLHDGLVSKIKKPFIISGVFFGLALLTKVNSIVFIPAAALSILVSKGRGGFKYILLILLPAALVFFLMFPAMWVSPAAALRNIFNFGIVGAPFRDYAGPLLVSNFVSSRLAEMFLSYPLVLIFRLSPVSFALSAFGILWLLRGKYSKKQRSFLFIIIFFMAFYYLSISIPGKKIYKYILPFFVGTSAFSALGLYAYTLHLKKYFKFLVIFFVIFVQLVYFTLVFPKFLLTYNPLIGGFSTASLFLVPDFESTGFYEAALYLNNKKLPDTATVATYPNKSLEPLTNLTVLDGRSSKDADYSLVPRLYRYPYGELLDISTGCFLPEKEFSHDGKEYLVLYKNLCR